ncbi:MAG: hypothetical protein K5895_13110 [Lachnospiraceae bacterium]|nr:hypothetical protein [Lachnospiraceae bacterium]
MLEQMNIEGIVFGIVILVVTYTLSIIINIWLVKGEYGFLPGTFKLYCLAVIVSVICNSLDVICIKYNISADLTLVKFILIALTLIRIVSLKSSGDPSLAADFKDVYAGELDPEVPFSSTEGMSFCVMVAYTFPIVLAIIVICVITLIQGVCNIEKYKFKRTYVLCAMAGIETMIASWLVILSYNLEILKALFFVALIGMFFNIVLGSLNGLLLDYVTGDYFLQDT